METIQPIGRRTSAGAPAPGQPAERLARLSGALRNVDPLGIELSIIEVVLLACDASEDQGEIRDLVDGLIQSGSARVLPAARDPLLSHRTEIEEAIPITQRSRARARRCAAQLQHLVTASQP